MMYVELWRYDDYNVINDETGGFMYYSWKFAVELIQALMKGETRFRSQNEP